MTRLVPLAACGVLLTVTSVRTQELPRAAGGGDDALRAALIASAERIVLPERCGECHAAELEVWETTGHATGFDTLHRRDRAKEIYRSLGLRLIKRGTDESTPACLSCHYTPVVRREQLRAGAGVTCESCHGPARDWISIHNSYGVAESDFQQAALLETPEHRLRRIADSREAGMRRPSDLYDVAANCFGCHTVPNEEIVNRGGHSTGSDFEIVAWSGRIRHNFLESYKTADGRTNAERPREWKRRMYVVGRALDLEYALRGVAAATTDDLYYGAMSDRAVNAADELLEINDRVALPAIQQIMATWNAVDLSPGRGPRLRAAADAMAESTRRFIAGSEGADLTALDPLWDPGAEDAGAEVSGRVTEIPDIPASPPTIDDDGPGGAGGAGSLDVGGGPVAASGPGAPPPTADVPAAPPAGTPVPSTAGPAASPRPSPPPRIETLTRPPWREPPAHAFVKVPCGRCHNSQERWWRSDPHSGTAKPFRRNDARYVEIARAYGVASGDMARGDRICMWCHGTPASSPSRKVRAGVGCQRCHGAGADYLEPHETVGYAASLTLGLTDLRDPATQASTCAGCHYVTEPGLINAGHPVGDGFEMRSRIDEIVHWGPGFGRDAEPADRAALASAYANVVAARGPAPVSVAAAPPPAAPVETVATSPAANEGQAVRPGVGPETQAQASLEITGGRVSAPNRPPPAAIGAVAAVLSPRSGPVAGTSGNSRRSTAEPSPVADPGLDELRPDPEASVEETLDALRRRIASLYGALGR